MTEQRNEPAQDTEESGWPLVLSDQGCFYVGGRYNDDTDTMTGQVFVQYQRPADLRYPFPVIMIHGGGQTGTGFLSTPDGDVAGPTTSLRTDSPCTSSTRQAEVEPKVTTRWAQYARQPR